MDLSDVLAGLNVSGGVAAIVGCGVLIAVVYFTTWLTNKVATFFDADDNDDEDDEEGECVYWYECDSCGYYVEDDQALANINSGYCNKCGE